MLGRGDDWLEIVIWNPDGSQAEISGNGTRIAARWLAEQTGAELVTRARRPARGERAHARRRRSSSRTWARSSVGEPEEVDGIRFTPVDVGNPHAVVEGDPDELPRIGPLLETHPRFPQRTNVQVARRLGDGEVEARVWERGVGETARPGTSAVAVAAALGFRARHRPLPGRPARRPVRRHGARSSPARRETG